MSMKLAELRSLSDAELEDKYDQAASHTGVGLNYYSEELARRSNERSNRIMLKYTAMITVMTAVMLIATLVNVVIACIK